MKIPAITQLLTPANLALSSGAIMGSRQTVELDQSNPISDIFIHLDLKFSTAPAAASSYTTIARLDSMANALRRVQLQANDGQSNGNTVDISGIGLLELSLRRGIPLSRGTHEVLKYMQLGASTTFGANNDLFRMTYHIPMVHPKITENLRTRCLFPAHLLQDKPQLILDFENISNMFPATGAISSAQCAVQVVRRRMPQSMTKDIQAKGGFIKWDLLETPKVVAQAQKQFPFDIPLGGQYLDLMLRSYLLNSTYTRDALDDTTTFGQESRWRIDLAGSTWADFRFNEMFSRNEILGCPMLYGQPVLAGSAVYLGAGSGAYGTGVDIRSVLADPTAFPILGTCGNGAQTSHFQSPGNIYFDYIGENDSQAWELGSLLDTNAIAQSGAKASIIGDVTTGQLNVVGHRLYGDLTTFQDQTI